MRMREQIEARLAELKRQFELGQTELQQLQTRENFLRETMLRISGAIQVLEETLNEEKAQDNTDSANAQPTLQILKNGDLSN